MPAERLATEVAEIHDFYGGLFLVDAGSGEELGVEPLPGGGGSRSGYVRWERWDGRPPRDEACALLDQRRLAVPSGVIELRGGFSMDMPGWAFDLAEPGAVWSMRVDRHVLAELPMLTYLVIRFWP
ncbi:hypothetical protein [Herbidospora cretacea]|uniref:hypothetical protein n=1 Tax=Herbidospora cretacea TaxID=28444 RepID=UPI0007732C80|nr:hypothetical protein [Herbidospora cretacea]